VASSTIKIEIKPDIDVSPQAEKEYTTFFFDEFLYGIIFSS